jgi:hypothetical protein
MKIIGAALGAVLLIFAITINSTTSNILTEAKSGGTVTLKFETGIWLSKRSKPGDVDTWDDSKPTYCSQDEDDGSCPAPKDSDCCKALASKCKTLKAFAVIGEIDPAAKRRTPQSVFSVRVNCRLVCCCRTHSPPHPTQPPPQVHSRRLDRSLGSWCRWQGWPWQRSTVRDRHPSATV